MKKIKARAKPKESDCFCDSTKQPKVPPPRLVWNQPRVGYGRPVPRDDPLNPRP